MCGDLSVYKSNLQRLKRGIATIGVRSKSASTLRSRPILELLEERDLPAPVAVAPVPVSTLTSGSNLTPIATQTAISSELVSIFMVMASTGSAQFLLSGPVASRNGPSGPGISFNPPAPSTRKSSDRHSRGRCSVIRRDAHRGTERESERWR